jgi:superfamily I DNA/RNA helicase
MIDPGRWQASATLRLEPNALRAIREDERSVALTAGPGAGKTETLAQRADYLLRTGACRYPQRILAISFKADASQNLKERVRLRCGAELASRLDSYTFHAFAKRLIDRFRVVLTGQDALDPDYTVGDRRIERVQITFSDMIPMALSILESNAYVRNAVRQTYSHVFLDEFQDCTKEQYRLILAAFGGTDARLTAVGDTKQRIMGFAGALEGVFRAYADDFKALPLNLYQNFRSLPRLRRMQNAMVRVMEPGAASPDGDLAGDGGIIEIRHFADADAEAAGIADLVQSAIRAGVPQSEVAVVVSKQPELYAVQLMRELSARGVVHRNDHVLQDLSVEPVARLIVDVLTLATADRAPDAYQRLMAQMIPAGLEEEEAYDTYARLQEFIDDVRMRVPARTLQEASSRYRATVEDLFKLLGRERVVGLSPEYQNGKRLDDLVSQTFARVDEALVAQGDPVLALARFSHDDAVRVMTIHKCKGLEFDTVVVLGVEEETFWADAESERCAFFVGASRAKRRLLLTAARRRPWPAGARRWDEVRTPHREFLSYAEGVM